MEDDENAVEEKQEEDVREVRCSKGSRGSQRVRMPRLTQKVRVGRKMKCKTRSRRLDKDDAKDCDFREEDDIVVGPGSMRFACMAPFKTKGPVIASFEEWMKMECFAGAKTQEAGRRRVFV